MKAWWRSPWFVGPAIAIGGTAIGIGSVALAIHFGRNAKREIQGNMRQTGPADFESKVGNTRLLFPAESWATASRRCSSMCDLWDGTS